MQETPHMIFETLGIRSAQVQERLNFSTTEAIMAAIMLPTYWWHVQQPNIYPLFFGPNQFPIITVFTGPPVDCIKPCKIHTPFRSIRVCNFSGVVNIEDLYEWGLNLLTRKNIRDAVALRAMKFIQNPTARRRIAEPHPMSPIPTIVGAWNRSPNEPEKKDPTEHNFIFDIRRWFHTMYTYRSLV